MNVSLAWAVLVVLIGIAVAWGDMRRQVSSNKERQDERHAENQEILREIRDDSKETKDDVKRINGTVARHNETLLVHGAEIERLRNKPTPRRR